MPHEATIHGVGMVADGGAGAPVVLLDVRDEIIPIFVDPGQAETIERGREGAPSERPLTHDLFARVLAELDATVERVRIDDLADETFYAKLDLTVDRGDEAEKLVQDARPSDGIALAVRVDCPILVDDDVIDAAGQSPAELGIEEPGPGPGSGPGGPPPSAGGGPGSGAPDLGGREAEDPFDREEAVDIDVEGSESDAETETREEDEDGRDDG